MLSRQDLADQWSRSAQLTRADVFGSADALRPEYSGSPVPGGQVDVPAVGMVGRRYAIGGVALLSVNPAGGKPDFKSDPASDKVYHAFRGIRDARTRSDAVRSFEQVTKAVTDSMPNWGIYKQHTRPILDAVGRALEEIAYLYLVPFRTRGDAGSVIPKPYLETAYGVHLQPQLALLRPGLVICVDRPSESAATRWLADAPDHVDVVYYTRKRDAHADRKELLQELHARYSARRA